MKKLLIPLILFCAINLNAQSIGINMGTNFISDKVMFREQKIKPKMLRPFTYFGINYRTKCFTFNLNYTFDLHIISFGSAVQIHQFKKRKQ